MAGWAGPKHPLESVVPTTSGTCHIPSVDSHKAFVVSCDARAHLAIDACALAVFLFPGEVGAEPS